MESDSLWPGKPGQPVSRSQITKGFCAATGSFRSLACASTAHSKEVSLGRAGLDLLLRDDLPAQPWAELTPSTSGVRRPGGCRSHMPQGHPQ